jgi:hypothetical protein
MIEADDLEAILCCHSDYGHNDTLEYDTKLIAKTILVIQKSMIYVNFEKRRISWEQ